jgi:hypothetical protein
MSFTGMMIGWGMFWLLIWGTVLFLFWSPRDHKEMNSLGFAVIGFGVSIFWILAWILVRLIG